MTRFPPLEAVAHLLPCSADADYNIREVTSGYVHGVAFSERAAVLFAAAPDLLAALRDLYDQCAMVRKHWGDGSNQAEADNAIRAGQAAIAKAEGRQP